MPQYDIVGNSNIYTSCNNLHATFDTFDHGANRRHNYCSVIVSCECEQ